MMPTLDVSTDGRAYKDCNDKETIWRAKTLAARQVSASEFVVQII